MALDPVRGHVSRDIGQPAEEHKMTVGEYIWR